MSAFNGRLAAVLAVGAGVGLAVGGFALAQDPVPTGSAEKARALTAAAPVDGPGEEFRGAALRAAADARAPHVPLPAGGTFNGVQWERGHNGTESDIEGVLEYNAACQWLRAWRDGREAALALSVLQEIPDWPALRGTESGEFLARVAREAADGGGETATNMLRQCDESHAREVEYARSLGLTPST